MKTTVKKMVELELCDKIICDFCDKELAQEDFDGGCLTIRFDYGSKFDMKYVELDICDECFEKSYEKFKYRLEYC